MWDVPEEIIRQAKEVNVGVDHGRKGEPTEYVEFDGHYKTGTGT